MVLLLLLQSKDARCHVSVVALQRGGEDGTPRKLELDYGLYLHLREINRVYC